VNKTAVSSTEQNSSKFYTICKVHFASCLFMYSCSTNTYKNFI